MCPPASLFLSVSVLSVCFLLPAVGYCGRRIKDSSVENLELKGYSFEAWRGQNIAAHASPTAGDFFLANFYLPGPFTFIFSKTSPEFVCVCVCVEADAGYHVECPQNIK